MSTSMIPELESLSFWRIVDVPFETCVAALDSWLRTRHGGELRFGGSQLLGPMEHDRDLGTRQIQVRLARGGLRPLLRMRLDIDRWSSSSTAVELIPGGRVRPTAAYFRAGHLLLDSLAGHLRQPLPAARARDAASQPRVPAGAGRPYSPPRAAVVPAHHEQVYAWECILLTSGVAPLAAAGPLRWVPSLGGYRLAGSHLPARDPAETGR